MRARPRFSRSAVLAALPLVLAATQSFAQTPGYQAPPPGYAAPAPAQPAEPVQPGYAPAQPGYPQQQHPGYAPSQQAYPAQPGYPQQQPGYPAAQPGYQQPGYPQPGYPPSQPAYAPAPYGYPPGYYAPPAPPPPSQPGFRRGFLFMPYLGLNIPVGTTGDYEDPGFRLGGILGGHVIPELSLNGELAIDVMNPKNGSDVTEVVADVLFSPLFHFGTPQLEVIVGPRLGVFGYSISRSGSSASGSMSGLSYGFNLGVAIPVGNMAIGGLLAYTGRHVTEICTSYNGNEDCTSDVTGDDIKSLALTGLLMF